MSDRDRHPTERHHLAELHALGTWPITIAALDALGPEYVLVFRRGVIGEMQSLLELMCAETYPPEYLDLFDRYTRALRHLGHTPTMGVPVRDAPAPPPFTPPADKGDVKTCGELAAPDVPPIEIE